MDFFGSKTPINWAPKEGRIELFKKFLGTLKANDITLIMSKSDRFVNHDVDQFLQNILSAKIMKYLNGVEQLR